MEGGVISDALDTRLAATLAGVEAKVAGHQNQIMFLSGN